MANKVRVQFRKGEVRTVATLGPSVGLVDKIKTYYGKIVVYGAMALAVLNDLTPVLNFLPGNDKNLVTAGLAVFAMVVKFLTKEQAIVDEL